MKKCEVSKILAYTMTVYTIASVYYLIRSKTVGTPFKDSLTDEQKKIKEESSKVRKQLFMEGILISVVIMYFTQPFKSC